jgi:hypothetical protein
MSGLINEKLQNAYKPPRAKLAMQTKEKIEIKNEIVNNVKINAPVKILFSCIKVCNGTAYRFLVYELANGKRGLIIERQATERLPRAIIAKPPAPLLHFVKQLKQTYGIA